MTVESFVISVPRSGVRIEYVKIPAGTKLVFHRSDAFIGNIADNLPINADNLPVEFRRVPKSSEAVPMNFE